MPIRSMETILTTRASATHRQCTGGVHEYSAYHGTLDLKLPWQSSGNSKLAVHPI